MAQNTNSLDPSIDYEACGTPPSEEPDPPGVYSKSIDPAYLNNFDPVFFNIFFWGIADDNGNWNGPQMTLQKAQDAVALLNEHFGPFNICFNLVGMDIITSTAYHDGQSLGSVITFAGLNGYVRENSYNVYVPNTFMGNTGAAYYFSTNVGIRACCVVHPSFIHEVGHSFNLYHTFGNSNIRPDPDDCERVTRDKYDLYYNATSAGDELHDTNAVPNFFREQHNYVAYAVEQANIGYSWTIARRDIAFSPIGFNSFPDAVAIEQALIDYGFTTAEINHLKFNPAVDNAYYDLATKTYTPDSRINDANSPFFKDCQGSPYQITTTDIKNFMAYTHSTSKELFTIGQGIRMHEAINNDNIRPSTQLPYNIHLVAAMSQHPLDLYIRDHLADIGQEPNIHTEVFWNSPDIWVRNYADGGQTHQNPMYNLNPNYVYVRVKNKGCIPSTGEETLELYWAKADTGLGGAALWTGIATGGPNNIPLGGQAGVLTIPVIEPGQEAIVQFTWQVPNPEDFFEITVNDWHFCLLARIVAPNDPMAYPNSPWVAKLNNNIAAKNVTVISLIQSGTNLKPGGAVSIGNMSGENEQVFDFNFFSTELDSAIFDEAEVLITLNPDAFNRWISGGNQAENIEVYNEEEGELIITGNHASLLNMQYGPDEWDILYLSFNFLTEEVTGKEVFEYHLVQKDTEGEVIGGEVYQIIRDTERDHFVADGDSYENTYGETEMTATDIGEPAVYNWYDPEGQLIHSGKDFSFIPEVPGDYLLEVIAETDGHKDYFKLTIAVNATQDQIISLSPNPATNTVTVEYQINQNATATTASLTVVSFFGNIQNNYAVDLTNSNTTTNINLVGYPVGYYAVILMVDGQAVHAKQLIIN